MSNLNADWVADKIIYTLINYDLNRNLLKKIPHIKYFDLAIIFRCVIHKDDGGIMTSIITENELKEWGLSKQKLKALAQKNTPRDFPEKIFTADEVISEMCGLPRGYVNKTCGGNAPMHFLSNAQMVNGAAVMLYDGALSRASKVVGGDMYVLPCSVHELIFIPADKRISEAEMLATVEVSNQKAINPHEILSYNIYHYDAKNEELRIIFA